MEITKEQINAWKSEHGKIYKVTPIAGLDIIYKPLSRTAYMDISKSQTEAGILDPEILTVKACIINDIDESIFEDRGGIISIIYEEIMKQSGFVIVESEEL